MVTGVVTAHAAQKLVTTKGSVNNRVNCAAEHVKNDVRTGLPLALAGGAVGIVTYKRPDLLTKTATALGKTVGSFGKLLANKVFKKGFGTGLLNKIIANPTKAGAAGLIAAGGLWVINKLCKGSYNAGQIDQKYADAAKLEGTKNVILD